MAGRLGSLPPPELGRPVARMNPATGSQVNFPGIDLTGKGGGIVARPLVRPHVDGCYRFLVGAKAEHAVPKRRDSNRRDPQAGVLRPRHHLVNAANRQVGQFNGIGLRTAVVGDALPVGMLRLTAHHLGAVGVVKQGPHRGRSDVDRERDWRYGRGWFWRRHGIPHHTAFPVTA